MAGRTRINPFRTDNDITLKQNDNVILTMNDRMIEFCHLLLNESKNFGVEEVTDVLIEYIQKHHRILYSQISTFIYLCYQENEAEEASRMIGTMLSNVEAIVEYTKGDEYEKKKVKSTCPEAYIDAGKAVFKIWDHISLAQQQYSMLRQSDDEYNRKIDEKLEPFEKELTKDVTAQLLTLIGIFTALAFLIFGGIGSLDNIFAETEVPLFKLMVIGSVWGLCMINLVFVFLFCVSKMTKLNFKSTEEENASIFKKYPIVWWSNWTILGIMLISILGYYFSDVKKRQWIDDICDCNPILFFCCLLGIIVIVMAAVAHRLLKECKYEQGFKLENNLVDDKRCRTIGTIVTIFTLTIVELMLFKDVIASLFVKMTLQQVFVVVKIIVPIIIVFLIARLIMKKNPAKETKVIVSQEIEMGIDEKNKKKQSEDKKLEKNITKNKNRQRKRKK